jgi:hypothetical protein
MRCLYSLLASICGLLLASACSTVESRARDSALKHRQWLESEAQSTRVDANDGISEVEAYVIGLERYAQLHTGCGAVSTPFDAGANWRVGVFAGYAGLLVEELVINKASGAVTYEKRPNQQPPQQFP